MQMVFIVYNLSIREQEKTKNTYKKGIIEWPYVLTYVGRDAGN